MNKFYEAQKKYALKNPIKLWAMQTICRHRKNNNVKVTSKELVALAEQTKFCIYCGTALRWERGKGKNPEGPSLDRKNNEKELTVENVQIICCRCNARKSSTIHRNYSNYLSGKQITRA